MSNSKIKVSEIFFSSQGEGRYQGVPSVFLRTFGCNFKCRNFGRDRDDASDNQEVMGVIANIDKYKSYNDLPLVATGCDSYAAVYPKFKHLSPIMTIDEIVDRVMGMLPFGEWRDEHFIFTGGEPLLGWQRSYIDLLEHPKMASLKEITFETNGTQELSPELKQYLKDWQSALPGREVTFSVSAKLPCSGESWSEAIQPEIVCEYEQVGTVFLKFVVATEDDANDALRAITEYRQAGFRGHVYLMPIGGVENVYTLNNKAVALLALKHGLRYSARIQCELFKNAWGT